ncbi:MAG: hypothetical protein U0610_24000 [bacterium]
MNTNGMIRRSALALMIVVGSSAGAAVPARAESEGDSKDLYLTGMDAWGQYCSNCHNPPPASDRAPHEWDTVLMHMRVRANLPAHTADAILEYMKAR